MLRSFPIDEGRLIELLSGGRGTDLDIVEGSDGRAELRDSALLCGGRGT
jgi:hypothetical protein